MKLRRIRNIFWWLLVVSILTISIFLALASPTSPTAIASVTHLEAAPGEILYRSQTKLDDQSGHVWQVVLFKQIYPGQNTSVNLRLVGFPNSAELIHPQPLKITTASGKVFTASDVFLDEAPAPTIGQYNFQNILPQLPNEPLQLAIPLPGQKSINISVPYPVVLEWQEVMRDE
ncbi:DUF3122 domain-containing protein [Aulosira sp. FACHB-615]|uniref:DUF3122 domain-containing protein n=1 Tax=Aulosira sp. FACHB-615 TaxID=2692777 RepID=UPI001682BE6D|nr:DUF3122 domain-containing protein [Aulosira sp. FACHB-615]MBD2487003.1 DUF3122 domain-containing protein [Aulosira sp. FACHB-615]